jgi:hypothetical protein
MVNIMLNSQLIANLLVKSVNAILLPHYKDWFSEEYPDHSLEIKAGSGKSTCHRFYPYTKTHVLTFGKKMIESKIHSQLKSSQWTTGKEINNRNYYGGNLTIQNCLAHCVIHEFAHFIQSLKFKREMNSVHNDDFYNILDEMHFKLNFDELVLDFLNKHKIFSELCFENDFTKEMPSKFNKNSMNIGNRITYKGKSGETEGFVTKINPKRVVVRTSRGGVSVPYTLVLSVDKDMSTTIYNKSNVPNSSRIVFMGKGGKEITANTHTVSNTHVMAECGMTGYKVPFHSIINVINISDVNEPKYHRNNIPKHSQIEFIDRSDTRVATTIRVNEKTVTASVGDIEYRIPYHLITNVIT